MPEPAAAGAAAGAAAAAPRISAVSAAASANKVFKGLPVLILYRFMPI
jgi:hypothetical protein